MKNDKHELAGRYAEWIYRNRWYVVAGSLVFIALLGIGLMFLRMNTSYRVWFNEGSEEVIEYDHFRNRFDQDDVLIIVFNDQQRSVSLKELPSNIHFPDSLSEKLHYDANKKLLKWKGTMSLAEKAVLKGLVKDSSYQKSMDILYKRVHQKGMFYNDALSMIQRLTKKFWKTKYVRRVDSLTNYSHTYVSGDNLEVKDLIEDKVPKAHELKEIIAKYMGDQGDKKITEFPGLDDNKDPSEKTSQLAVDVLSTVYPYSKKQLHIYLGGKASKEEMADIIAETIRLELPMNKRDLEKRLLQSVSKDKKIVKDLINQFYITNKEIKTFLKSYNITESRLNEINYNKFLELTGINDQEELYKKALKEKEAENEPRLTLLAERIIHTKTNYFNLLKPFIKYKKAEDISVFKRLSLWILPHLSGKQSPRQAADELRSRMDKLPPGKEKLVQMILPHVTKGNPVGHLTLGLQTLFPRGKIKHKTLKRWLVSKDLSGQDLLDRTAEFFVSQLPLSERELYTFIRTHVTESRAGELYNTLKDRLYYKNEALQKKYKIAMEEKLVRELLISYNKKTGGTTSQILLTPKLPDNDQSKTIDFLQRVKKTLRDEEQRSGYHYHVAGLPEMSLAFKTYIGKDMELLLPMVFVFILLTMLYLFRPGWGIIAITSVIVVFVVMVLSISAITGAGMEITALKAFKVVITLVLLAEFVNFSVLFVRKYRRFKSIKKALKETVLKLLDSIWGMISPILVVIFAIIGTLGISGYIGYELNNITSMSPQILIAVGIADSIHILTVFFRELHHGESKKDAMITSIKMNLLPVFLTSVTTALGFLSLLTSISPPIRILGVIVAIGTLVAFLVTVTFLPAVLTVFKYSPQTGHHKERSERWTLWLGKMAINYRMPILVVFSVISIFSVYFITRIHVDNNPVGYFKKGTYFRDAMDFINDTIRGANLMEISINVVKLPEQVPAHIFEEDILKKAGGKKDKLLSYYSKIQDKSHYVLMGDIPKYAEDQLIRLLKSKKVQYDLSKDNDESLKLPHEIKIGDFENKILKNVINQEDRETLLTYYAKDRYVLETARLKGILKPYVGDNPMFSDAEGHMILPEAVFKQPFEESLLKKLSSEKDKTLLLRFYKEVINDKYYELMPDISVEAEEKLVKVLRASAYPVPKDLDGYSILQKKIQVEDFEKNILKKVTREQDRKFLLTHYSRSKYVFGNVISKKEENALIVLLKSDPIGFKLPNKADAIKEPAFMLNVEKLQRHLEDKKVQKVDYKVSHTSSLVDIMKTMNQRLNGDNKEYYKIPDSRKILTENLFLYTSSVSFGRNLNNQISSEKSAIRLTIRRELTSSEESLKVIKAVKSYIADHLSTYDVKVTGRAVIFTDITPKVTTNMVWGLILALIVITIVLILTFRSIKMGLLSLIPNVIPLMIMFGVIGLSGVDFNMGLSMVALITLGIVVDDTIHFITKYLRSRSMGKDTVSSLYQVFHDVGSAIIFTSVILTVGFGISLFSNFVFNIRFGTFTALTMVIALFADLMLLPAILLLRVKKKDMEGAKVKAEAIYKD